MRKLNTILLRIFVLVLLSSLFSGCYMFSKKNRCGDCPKWHKTVLGPDALPLVSFF